MTGPGRGPGRWHRAPWLPLLSLVVLAPACGSAVATQTPATVPWVTGLGGSLTVGIDRAPSGCNPNSVAGNTWANHFVLAPVLPSAFVTSPGGQSIYDSAVITQAEVQSLNPQTVVYSINPKAVWSDGQPISAADFVYAWQQQRGGAPAAGESAAGQMATTLGYRDIQSVTPGNDGRTVTVVFKTPYADWQALFNDLLPAHIMEKVGWSPGCTTVDPAIDLSGGPFRIFQVVPGKEIVLTKNPRWWGESVDLDRLVIRTGAGPAQLAHWLISGQSQAVQPSAFNESFLENIGTKPGLDGSVGISSTFLQLEFSAISAVTGAPQVRLAIAHAIDRQALVNSAVGWADSNIVPAASHLYSQAQGSYPGPATASPQIAALPGYRPPAPSSTPTPAMPFPLTDDHAAVVRDLTTAGYTRAPVSMTWSQPNGSPIVVRLVVDGGDPWASRAGAVIVSQLAAAGITTTVTTEPDVISTGLALASGAADAALLPMTATPYASEATAWYTTMLGPPGTDGSQDWMNYEDPALDTLLTQAAQQLDPVKASPIYAQADLALWSSMIALPLFAEPTVLAWSSSSSGIGPNQFGPGLLWFPETWGIRVPPTSPITAPH